MTDIWVFFDKLNSVGHKNFKSFRIFVIDVAQDNFTIRPEVLLDFRMNYQFLSKHHWNSNKKEQLQPVPTLEWKQIWWL